METLKISGENFNSASFIRLSASITVCQRQFNIVIKQMSRMLQKIGTALTKRV